jgi:hypothetical protein
LRITGLAGPIALLLSASALAENLTVAGPASSESLAFARYIASTKDRDPFTDSGPVAVKIDASLPGLYKEASLLAVREIVETERSEYRIIQGEGDAIVAQEVIARYFLMQQQLESLPLSSVAITPANYKFHYKGEIGTGSALAYVYEITPRKKRDGLVQGRMWIDSTTGEPIMLAGRLIKAPVILPGKIEVVRNIELVEGNPRARVTHVSIETANAGRGELNIIEIPLSGREEESQWSPAPASRQ